MGVEDVRGYLEHKSAFVEEARIYYFSLDDLGEHPCSPTDLSEVYHHIFVEAMTRDCEEEAFPKWRKAVSGKVHSSIQECSTLIIVLAGDGCDASFIIPFSVVEPIKEVRAKALLSSHLVEPHVRHYVVLLEEQIRIIVRNHISF